MFNKVLLVNGTKTEPIVVTKVSCSENATMFLTANGSAYGTGDYIRRSGASYGDYRFIKLNGKVSKVLCGNWLGNWYITESGTLWGCGRNDFGDQGIGSEDSMIGSPFTKRADNVDQVFADRSYTWYITKTGELYGSGNYSSSSLPPNSLVFTKFADNVAQVTGSWHTMWYVTKSGELYGCGSATRGQQGNGDNSYEYEVTTFTKRAENVSQVACSDYTTWYLSKSGELYGCGGASDGQQGSGSTSDVKTFTKRADNVAQVVCSASTTWYVTKSGQLYGCGDASEGQQGSGSTSDVLTFTKRADNVAQVVCSGSTTWYVTKTGELYGCGSVRYGQQGNGASGYGVDGVASFTKRADNVAQVACSEKATWYVTKAGELYGCGSGAQGSGSYSDVVSSFTKRP